MAPNDLHADLGPDDLVLRGLLGDMHSERRRAALRRRLAVLLGALALMAASCVLTRAFDAGVAAGAAHRPAVTVIAADPVTGVRAGLGTARHDWGTEVLLELRDGQGPRDCALFVVDRTGAARTIGGWTVAAPSAPGASAAVSITAATALQPDAIDHFEVRSGTGQLLLSIHP
ncbi:hypothetical protein [Kitasatospora azatica]|uniref:hypothetical protein n=1 Tax=Kitasatospora azatica TaxID=58347 RepID=UPI0012F8005C|nr:hypothetical protein [Kitasatospora azatica]